MAGKQQRDLTSQPDGPGFVFSDEHLAEGRRLAEEHTRTQFALGDLALRVAGPAPARGARNGSYTLLATFADEIGVSGDSMRQYRFVAGAWPEIERIEGASWSLHRALANEVDRHDKLADFIAAARKGEFKPTRTKLMSWLRERHQTDPGSSADDVYGIRARIRWWADEKSGWINRTTKEPQPWDLLRRRAWGLLLMVDTVQLPRGSGDAGGVAIFDEQLMTDILAVADVLPRMRLAFGSWVARMYAGRVAAADGVLDQLDVETVHDLADEVIEPGRLPDVEALTILWEAMQNWAMTPDGQRGWRMVVSALGHNVRDAADELQEAVKSPNATKDVVLPFIKANYRAGFAAMLSGQEDMLEVGRGMVDLTTDMLKRLGERQEAS